MARKNNADTKDLQRQLERDLMALYEEVDHAFTLASCPASTECCRFGVTGREPYVTSIELAVLERAIGARGGARVLRRSPPPLEQNNDAKPAPKRLQLVDERVCPMLDVAGRCVVYQARPFGCRTFFCERATDADHVGQREINEFVRRIKVLASAHAAGGDVGRPLMRALEGGSQGPGPKRKRGR